VLGKNRHPSHVGCHEADIDGLRRQNDLDRVLPAQPIGALCEAQQVRAIKVGLGADLKEGWNDLEASIHWALSLETVWRVRLSSISFEGPGPRLGHQTRMTSKPAFCTA
jgi:hypothetical protein